MKKLLLILLISLGFIGSANADKDSVLAEECVQKLMDLSSFYSESGFPTTNDIDGIPRKVDRVKFSSTYTLTGKSGSLWDFEVDHGYCEWFGLTNPPLYQAEENHLYSCHTNRFTALKVYLIGRNRFNEKDTNSYECAFRGNNYTLDAIKQEIDYTALLQGKGLCPSCRRTL